MKSLLESWKKFWFEPVSAYPLAVFRIGFGLVMLVNLFGQYLPFYGSFYGPESYVSSESIFVNRWQNLPVFDLLIIFPQHEELFLWAAILTAFSFTLGFATRISTIILFILLLSLNNHCPIILHAGDNYARLVMLFLCFTNAGKVLSLDSLLKKGDDGDHLIEPVSMRLIQMQFCFIYLINGLYKASGQIWQDGSAVYYATRLTQYFRFPYPQFLDTAMVSQLLTWSTLVIEFALVFLLWPKRTRYYMIVVAFFFHLSLDLTFNLGVFEWFFIVTLLLFVETEQYKKIPRRFKKKKTLNKVAS